MTPRMDQTRSSFAWAITAMAMLAFASLAQGLSSLGQARADGSAKVLNVVATTSMIADAARQIGGEAVSVKALMGPGVDPHAYRQTRSDIAAMVRADLVLYNGLDLEAQMVGFFEDLTKRTRVTAVAEAVPKTNRLGSDEHKSRFDPHVWMSPEVWSLVVTKVREELSALLPEQSNVFKANADSYLERINKLSEYAQRALATVPENQRVILTAHDAFSYFGKAFGFEVIGIQGISTESEAGLNRIKSLVDTIVERKIRAVFVESSVADRNIRAVIEGAAARGSKVTIGGELFSDAMGEPGTYEGTYVGMFDHNATVITRALGGSAPERGMTGSLSAPVPGGDS